MEMGFDEKEVIDALRVNNNQQDAAVGGLLYWTKRLHTSTWKNLEWLSGSCTVNDYRWETVIGTVEKDVMVQEWVNTQLQLQPKVPS